MADKESTAYGRALEISQRVSWALDDVLPESATFDFDRPFLPDALSGTNELAFLSRSERVVANQICGHTYLSVFGLVEEFILPFVLDHARSQLGQDDTRTRALLQFASEEAKHIHLFRRFREVFAAGFGMGCEVIGPADAIGRAVRAHGPLGVGIAILHIEWMTQRHYVEAVKGEDALDPAFARLLEKHWVEEAQHARLDGLIVESLAASVGPAAVAASIDDYAAILTLLDGGLTEQVELDLRSLERAIGRVLSAGDRETFREVGRKASRLTYLASGTSHPQLLAVLDRISPAGADRVRSLTARYL